MPDKNLLYVLLPSSFRDFKQVGIENRVVKEINYLADNFQNIFLISADFNKNTLLKKNVIQIFPKFHINNRELRIWFTIFWGLFKILPITKKIDYVFCRYAHGTFLSLFPKLFRKKVVLWYPWSLVIQQKDRSFFRRVLNNFIEIYSFKFADSILSYPKEVIRRIEKVTDPKKIKSFPNFIDTELFSQKEIKDLKRIVTVASLHKRKKIDDLIKAVGKSKFDYELTIIGDGPEKESLEKLCNELNVNVKFLGKLENDEVAHELKNADIFVLPSSSEGNPKALMEAMSCGLICIGRNVVGIKDLLNENRGKLFNDEDELIILLDNLILAPSTKDFSINARKYIVQNFSPIQIFSNEVKLIKQENI